MKGSGQEIADYLSSNRSSFTLIVEGLPKVEGELRIAVFNSRKSYTEDPIYAVILPVDQNIIEWKVEALPYGEYAIAAYHDQNKNGKLDTNLLGIPKEMYGFSNDARGRFGPASWNDASFKVTTSNTKHLIRIK